MARSRGWNCIQRGRDKERRLERRKRKKGSSQTGDRRRDGKLPHSGGPSPPFSAQWRQGCCYWPLSFQVFPYQFCTCYHSRPSPSWLESLIPQCCGLPSPGHGDGTPSFQPRTSSSPWLPVSTGARTGKEVPPTKCELREIRRHHPRGGLTMFSHSNAISSPLRRFQT